MAASAGQGKRIDVALLQPRDDQDGGGCRRKGKTLVRSRRALMATLALLAPASMPTAAPLPSLASPRGEVLLRVGGSIRVRNQGAETWLDRAALEGLGPSGLPTATPWSEGEETFKGMAGARLLDALGAFGTTMVARALNDDKADLPVGDFDDYPVLLALERDGQPMTTRRRGPIWIVYPFSRYPKLDDRIHRQRSAWQLGKLFVT